MITVNENFLKLQTGYLFPEIGKRRRAFQQAHPDAKIISMGIGDVTQPVAPAVIEAMHKAIDEMGKKETFRGYDDGGIGYAFLREAIAKNDYKSRGVSIDLDEIFISDGAKSDTANIQELFGLDNIIAVADPVYPVYVDTNVMAGRTGAVAGQGTYLKIVYMPATAENGFVPDVPREKADMIYLCFPNNPTGAVATKAQLAAWVDYARRNRAVILFDSAYEAYIRDPQIPHSIYEIEGARDVAIEFRSFSKTAGFTGVRCAYAVVPKTVTAWDKQGRPHALHGLWNRRHTTKFNGVSYPVQRAAAAVFTDAGRSQARALTDFYLGNAKLIRSAMAGLGFTCAGGENAPYIWVNVGRDSWEFFDLLLEKAQVVCTPGAGFGKCGEGHVRISAFNSRENVEQALERIAAALR